MILYRDNANAPAPMVERPALSLPPVVPQPDTVPWGFRTREDFPELMNRWGLTGTGIEVGCYRGGFATTILKSWPGVLYCVDPWEYQPQHRDMLNTPDQATNEAIARNELSKWTTSRPVQRCYIIKDYSVNAANDWVRVHGRNPQIDFVYVDALHDYQSVTDDLNAWAPLIRSGGALCGHDYIQHPTTADTVTVFNVIQAVTDWRERNGYSEDDLLLTPDEGYKSWVIRLR